MYSSYWIPKDGRYSSILTDHEALARDEKTHKSIQSDETQLRPIDLETIMSSKAAVKFWYLHRPKTIRFVHETAVKIQSVGRAYAVRQLIRKYGVQYTVELAKLDAQKKHKEWLAELSEEERRKAEQYNLEYEKRVAESRRAHKERKEQAIYETSYQHTSTSIKITSNTTYTKKVTTHVTTDEYMIDSDTEPMELDGAESLQHNENAQSDDDSSLGEYDDDMERNFEKYHSDIDAGSDTDHQDLENAKLLADLERCKLERESLEVQLTLKKLVDVVEDWVIRDLKELELQSLETEHMRAEEELVRMVAEEWRSYLYKAEQIRMDQIAAERNMKYEQSFARDVPVIIQEEGRGRIICYDKTQDTYKIRLSEVEDLNSHDLLALELEVQSDSVFLDDARIISPRTKVSTPFGVARIIGLDPHVGCYAVHADLDVSKENERLLAFVQIKDIELYATEVEEKAIVDEDLPLPEEIGLIAARIIDSRVVSKKGEKCIQYKLEIKTNNYGTVYCWKRYSTFRNLCDRLHKEAGIKKKDIPDLPRRQIIGNFSQKKIGERAEKLNWFLSAAVKAEHLQWGIRVDDRIAVYKRRVKKRRTAPHEQNA